MSAALLWLAVCAGVGSNPAGEVLVDRVSLVEWNHYYDENGKHVFDQLIFYDWSPADGRHQVRAWRLLKDPRHAPVRDWRRGGYVAVLRDGDLLREVRADALRETWTQHDPELIERTALPKEQRRDLTKPLLR